ncbi:MAG: hypothetical protein V4726_04340 [Verrucomicrobiota bacterium]
MVAWIPSLLAGLLFPCAVIQAAPQAASSHYTNGPGIPDFGGGPGASASYSQVAGITETAGDSSSATAGPPVTARIGHIGQLYEITSLLITANPAALNEGGDSQLSAKALLDDLSVIPLTGTAVTWSVVSGPLFGISVTGGTTAENVSQPATATVRATYAGAQGTLTLTILDSIPDNFGTYAGDGIHDGWQTQHFGANPAQAGMNDDPDHDGVSNFLEYAFGMTPTQSDAGALTYSGSTLTSPGLPTAWMQPTPSGVDLRAVFVRRTFPPVPALRYTVQFSADLTAWQSSAAVPDVRAAGPGVEVVSVRYPLFLNNGRKARFFRVQVENVTPAP